MGSGRHKKARAQRKAANSRRAQSFENRQEPVLRTNGFLWSGSGQNDDHLTMSQEARNTERHHRNYNVQLRHMGVHFVSAGDLRRDDTETLTEEREGGMVDGENVKQQHIPSPTEETEQLSPHLEPDAPANGTRQDDEAPKSRALSPGMHSAEENSFFYDYGGGKTSKPQKTIPPPQTDPDPEHSDSESSEDEVVFAGRGRVARHPFAPDHRVTLNTHQSNIEPQTQPTAIDDSLYLTPTSEADPFLRRESPLLHSEPQTFRESDWLSISTPPVKKSKPRHNRNPGSTQRYMRSADDNDEDEILADYIANMVHDSPPDDDTDASSESEQSDMDPTIDAEAEDGPILPDDLPTEISRVFSMRQSGRSFEYLVTGADQGPDEARWVRKELLTMPGAGESIRVFEEQAVLTPSGIAIDELEQTSDEEAEERDVFSDELDQTMTDEQLARAIAEQDMLGLGHSDGLFGVEDLDDLGYVSQGLRSKKGKKKKNRGARTEFPSASAFADALDEDSYGAFDIMNFERPSLKKKQKGKHQNVPDFGLSDSDLAWELEASWDNDRKKKKMKKREREELRALGLLGGRPGKVNMKAKYSEGMGFDNIKQEIRSFLLSSSESLSLPPMDKKDRKTVHEIANLLSLKSLSRGHGSSRFPVLTKTTRTPNFSLKHMNDVERLFSNGRFARRTDRGRSKRGDVGMPPKARGGTKAASHMDGDIVGASAPEIGMENRGRVMLEKMGWSTGTALGAVHNKGILQPVAHIVKNSKAGLG